MNTTKFRFSAKVWLYPGDEAWHFVSLPKKESAQVEAMQAKKVRRGWGAVRVTVNVGKTSWDTSMFPHKQSGTYILPLKAAVRKKEGIMVGDTILLSIRLQEA